MGKRSAEASSRRPGTSPSPAKTSFQLVFSGPQKMADEFSSALPKMAAGPPGGGGAWPHPLGFLSGFGSF